MNESSEATNKTDLGVPGDTVYALLSKRRELKLQLKALIENRKPEDVITMERRMFGYDKETLEYTQQVVKVETTREEEALRNRIQRLKSAINYQPAPYLEEDRQKLREEVIALWVKRNAEGITENLIEVSYPGLVIMADRSIVFSTGTRWSTEEEEEILLILQRMQGIPDMRWYHEASAMNSGGTRPGEVAVHGAATLTSQCRTAQSKGRQGSGFQIAYDEEPFAKFANAFVDAKRNQKPTLMDLLIKRRLGKS